MSQLAAAPLRTAKQLQKLKEIKKVKAAIRWHERARKKRQAIAKDRHESKSTAISLQAWTKENAHDIEKRALRNAREDWFLGPLRPNRAIGSGAGRYGAMEAEELRRPAIPVRVQKNRNEVREKKGLQLEYPFVVDDKKYFHIVQDDRVVLMKGREKGKIGVVDSISEESHEAIVKDLNKVLLCAHDSPQPRLITLPALRRWFGIQRTPGSGGSREARDRNYGPAL